MAWERRKRGGLYYTESYRENGRVRRRYIGSGPTAELIAQYNALQRDEREDKRARLLYERDRHREEDEVFHAYFSEVSATVEAALVAAGYHKHKGQWRKRRVTRDTV